MPCPRCAMNSCLCPPSPKIYAVAAPPPRAGAVSTRCIRCMQVPCCCPRPAPKPRMIVSPPPRSCGTPSQDLPAKVRQPVSPLGPALVQVTCPRCSQAILYPAPLISVCGCGLRSLVPIVAAPAFEAPVFHPVIGLRIPSPIELDMRLTTVEEKINGTEW